jgi:hypothetical protein
VPIGGSRLEVDARLNHGISTPLGGQARLDRRKNFVIGDLEFFDIETVEIGDINRRQGATPAR